MNKLYQGLCKEFKEMDCYYWQVKNELDGQISLMLEELFNDFLCINSWCENEKICFELDEEHRKFSESQIKEIERITHSTNTEGLKFTVNK